MQIDSSGLRQRRGIQKIVEDLDIFDKVVDNIKEEKKVSSGLISFICFSAITVLFFLETYQFLFTNRTDYRFDVDTAMNEMPILDIDMIIATPCNNLQVISSMDQSGALNPFAPLQTAVKKDPTRFEFTDEEQLYWTVLRHAHSQLNNQGLRGIDELQYIDSDVESTLEHLADEKQQEEAAQIEKQRQEKRKENGGRHPQGQIMFLVGNGMGMFQLVSDSGNANEGTACRVHGKFPVRKAKEEKIVISIGGPLMIMNHFDGQQSGNISHRIEKFNFGPRISGLVTPLAGAEHISENGQDIYRYFIKIVPTKIYGYFTYTMAYQYSVTFLKKKLKEGEHSHGGILFEYEFTANVIEVRRASISFFKFFIRLCSIIGGVYATSTLIDNIVQAILAVVYPSQHHPQVGHFHGSRTAESTDSSHASLIIDSNIKVH